MNDKFVNGTGVQTIKTWIEGKFALDDDLDTVEGRVDDLEQEVSELITEGGEPNVIETVKVNNTALVPDANKAVNIDLSGYAETSDIPTDLADLTNTGQDPYATESYVEANGGKIQKVKVNNVEQTIDTSDKSVNITVPTAISDLTNDENFIDNTVNNLTNYYLKSETYTQSEVDALISGIVTLNVEVVQTLPTQDISTTTIYLVPKSTAKTNNTYDEYLYINNAWELIGDTQLDLSNYWNSTNLQALTVAEINAILEPSS